MTRNTAIIVTLAVAGTLGGLAYVHATRDDDATAVAPPATMSVETLAIAVKPKEPAAQASATPQVTNVDVSRWIADAQSTNAKTRAAAIEALANAPKAQAIPALKRVLESGEPQIDRQIALRSLHVLALNDGDNNGEIRDAIRRAMYHSEDEGVTQSAQAFLEDIEAALADQIASAPN